MKLKKLWRKYKVSFLPVFILMVVLYVVHILHISLAFNDSINPSIRNNVVLTTSNEKKNEFSPPADLISSKVAIIADNNVILPQPQPITSSSTTTMEYVMVKDTLGLNADKLPGLAKHPILGLDQKAFRNTPVSEQMSWYGQAQGGGSCSGDFGNQLIDRWRQQKHSYCNRRSDKDQQPVLSSTNKIATSLNSSIDCYLIKQTRHHGAGDQLCHMHNVAVSLSIFGDDTLTRPVVQEYVNSKHFRQPYIKFPKGFIYGDCSPDPQYWKSIYMPGWNSDLTVGAFENNPSKQLHPSIRTNTNLCEEWIEHPVLLQQRDTFANFFHDSEDFFNVFIAMAILKWKPGDTQVFLTDLYPKGPFWDIWSKVFSQRPSLMNHHNSSEITDNIAMTAWDLRLKYGKKNKYICFKDLAIGIYGPAAPMTVNSWNTPCRSTALIRAYSDYVIRGLGLQHDTHYANPKPNRTIVITYMARRASKEWPEKKYCDSQNSFFLCKLWDNFGVRKLGRMISNDQEVVQELKKLERNTVGQFSSKIERIIVQDVDYNILSFEEQIVTDLRTDIMIGPHGAGLMHNIFMRDRAKLIELFIDGSGANRHFHNLANWYGRAYLGVPISNPISINELVNLVKDAILQINLDEF